MLVLVSHHHAVHEPVTSGRGVEDDVVEHIERAFAHVGLELPGAGGVEDRERRPLAAWMPGAS